LNSLLISSLLQIHKAENVLRVLVRRVCFKHVIETLGGAVILACPEYCPATVQVHGWREWVEISGHFAFGQALAGMSGNHQEVRVPIMCRGVVWVEIDSVLKVGFGLRPVPSMFERDDTERGMCFGQRVVNLQRFSGCCTGEIHGVFSGLLPV